MSNLITSYFSQLLPDEWRKRAGFSPEVQHVHDRLFGSDITEAEVIVLLSEWLQKHQPCLFGRIAAKLDSLSYCVLTEQDLDASDEEIKDKIQAARLFWTHEGYEGRKSGFVIHVVSERIASALPDENMKQLARRLCFLYLGTEIEMDNAYLEEVFLEKPGQRRTTWKWYAGVNYFCAQGDGRWWNDHRIPGGMAISVNSVGHFVKSGIISKKMQELEDLLGAPEEGYPETKIDSLGKALEVAMRTISLASPAVSGKATELLPLPQDKSELPIPESPIELPAALAEKDFTKYKGYYHTDYTLPSDYFLPTVERPTDKSFSLDFTYLFHRDIGNPDFITMGEGQQIRADNINLADSSISDPDLHSYKRLLTEEESVPIEENNRLVRALNLFGSKG